METQVKKLEGEATLRTDNQTNLKKTKESGKEKAKLRLDL